MTWIKDDYTFNCHNSTTWSVVGRWRLRSVSNDGISAFDVLIQGHLTAVFGKYLFGRRFEI